MEFGPASFGLAYVAGLLSTLSPCVLPLLPILVASALHQHRWGAWALALGLSLSFTATALFIATLGFALDIDGTQLRRAASVLLIAFGLVLAWDRLQASFARAAARLGAAGEAWAARVDSSGWAGQFLLGTLLGLVWAPCVGPTLGAATTLATRGTHLPQVAALLLVFGLGAGTPLLLVGQLSQQASRRWRDRLAAASRVGRRVLGLLLVGLGVAILAGWDKRLEARLLGHLPAWLNELSMRF
jgi:cytochrome c biogenesis protein CcdA